jgi:hypothetical protein
MVKMSVDFPSEAALCQRFLSSRAQSNFGSRGKCGPFCFARSETKRKKPPLRRKHVNLRPERRCFCRPKVIVDHEPAGIVEQVTVAIQVPAHIVVRVEDEQPDIAGAQASTNF